MPSDDARHAPQTLKRFDSLFVIQAIRIIDEHNFQDSNPTAIRSQGQLTDMGSRNSKRSCPTPRGIE